MQTVRYLLTNALTSTALLLALLYHTQTVLRFSHRFSTLHICQHIKFSKLIKFLVKWLWCIATTVSVFKIILLFGQSKQCCRPKGWKPGQRSGHTKILLLTFSWCIFKFNVHAITRMYISLRTLLYPYGSYMNFIYCSLLAYGLCLINNAPCIES